MDWGRWINDTSIKQRYLNEVAAPKTNYDAAIKDMKEKYAAFTKVFTQFLKSARELGIIFVTAAGNEGFEWDDRHRRAKVVVATGDSIPNNLGGSMSELITVGAATKDGKFAYFTSPQGVHINGDLVQDPSDPRLWRYGDPNMGSIDIWAPGKDVPTCGIGDGVLSTTKGTSPASAVTVSLFGTFLSFFLFAEVKDVLLPFSLIKPLSTNSSSLQSGLLAYFLADPGLGSRFTWSVEKNKRRGWGKRMKQYLTALSYQWVDGEDGVLDEEDEDMEQYFQFKLPSLINMAYNGAFGPMSCEYPE